MVLGLRADHSLFWSLGKRSEGLATEWELNPAEAELEAAAGAEDEDKRDGSEGVTGAATEEWVEDEFALGEEFKIEAEDPEDE